MPQRLIYDVGVNDGADTAFYLSLGHRVIGIEASPFMAEALRGTFAKEIADGRFTLLDIGIAETEGALDFWESRVSEWSSFHREIASRNGTPHYRAAVRTRLFKNVIEENGVPFYCKIDIEGNDRLCLMGLTPDTAPEYISIEMSHADGGRDLALLKGLGYDRFKLISQVTRAQPIRFMTTLGYALPERWARASRKLIRKTAGVGAFKGWTFPANASGAFAEDTPGPWRSYEAAHAMWAFLRDVDLRFGKNGLGEWFDFHATKSKPA